MTVPPLILGILFLTGTAYAAFDSAGWRYFRQIRIPKDFDRGHVVVPLESAILEQCRPDMGDLRVISSGGEVVPMKLECPEPTTASRPFPAEVYRVARRPGKWTDAWIDKSGKIITRGILIQTSSEDFVRIVEIRGTDNGRDSYVIRMDGLIASRRGSSRTLVRNVFHCAASRFRLVRRALSRRLLCGPALQPLPKNGKRSFRGPSFGSRRRGYPRRISRRVLSLNRHVS
ncbi:MAG: hypothetical protein P8182_03165 [Deltaproteobacteria bacterium]